MVPPKAYWTVAPAPAGVVVNTGVRVMVRLLFDSTAVTGDVTVPDVVDASEAVNAVVLRMIGWLNVTVRTPVDVIVPGAEFDAEVANSSLFVTDMFTMRVVEFVPTINAAGEAAAS